MKQKLLVAGIASLARISEGVNTSPFVGDHKHASVIDHGNGRLSSKMKPVAAPYNKYEKLLKREGHFEDRVSWFSRISEALFGREETSYEKARNKHELKKKGIKSDGAEWPRKPKLGSSILGHDLINLDGTMWTGELYMGGNTKMDVVYDTGSDWLVIEGNECSACEGNVYNPSNSQGNP